MSERGRVGDINSYSCSCWRHPAAWQGLGWCGRQKQLLVWKHSYLFLLLAALGCLACPNGGGWGTYSATHLSAGGTLLLGKGWGGAGGISKHTANHVVAGGNWLLGRAGTVGVGDRYRYY